MIHKSVLLDEVVEFFSDCRGLIIDLTLGLGGHSRALLEKNPNIFILGNDRDSCALELAKQRLSDFGARFSCIRGNFGDVDLVLQKACGLGFDKISGILADIGVSSLQLDDLSRGFSFQSDILDMRMDVDSELDAKMILNSYSKNELENILKNYGEIRNPAPIVRAILEYRKNKKFQSASELANLPCFSGFKNGRIHPATLVFQAIRIAVNDELGELTKMLEKMQNLKSTKVAIISFHSLEDRIVKDVFKSWNKACICQEDAMKCSCGKNHAKGSIINKKPIVPTSEEIKQNPRARSAKMRCFRFHG